MILGIDFGITTTDAALLDKCSVLKAFYCQPGQCGLLEKKLSESRIDLEKVEEIAVTGANSCAGKLFGKPVSSMNELEAIGFGGAFLAKCKKALVVSMGTGTCIVSFDNGRVRHAAGTALGGGTIIGLSKRLFAEHSIEKLRLLAGRGNLRNVDLSVQEAIGRGIGLAPGSATASNFVKDGRAGKADLALAVQNMVGESNAIIAALAAKSAGHKKIVFVGKTTLFPAVKRALRRVLHYYGFSPVFPRQGAYASAIGAAVFQGNCFK